MTSGGRHSDSFDRLRAIALSLAGVEETTSYGTPAFRVGKKTFLRLREDGESLVLWTDEYERDHLLETDPHVFFVTDHYRGYPIVLVHPSRVTEAQLRALVTESWRRFAPKRLIAQFDGGADRG